ncbi:hypothetical protein OG352_29800 [Streptomyces sp. NBC_01485]|uniref:hypothetical protein n=1 Tax=Streptomyces sp. NBC_01485 TaxID=2903884 RepID=UPI002E320A3C|nr:hypothetical protein [Streptomyces sp. NBC_01485]
MVASVTDEHVNAGAEADSLPIDVETITETVDVAWGMSLSTSTRKDIDARTAELIGHLNLLVGQRLDEDENRGTLRLLRAVERHLVASNRPTSRTQAHDAYNYLRDTAIFTSTLLGTYQQVHGVKEG